MARLQVRSTSAAARLSGPTESQSHPRLWQGSFQTLQLEYPLQRLFSVDIQAGSFTTTPAPSGASPVATNLPPEHLASVRHLGGAVLSLRFSDGYTGRVDLSRLGMDVTMLRLDTARVSWGSAVEVDDTRGETVHIDSAVLRAYCDPQYAAQLEAAIASASGNRGR